jgi:ApaG protein
MWFFIYEIEIENQGEQTVQLLTRHWRITDANGEVEEVRGPGVVGEKPVLGPGESFRYSSGCPLKTPFGSMQGSYQMTTDRGVLFDIGVPPFALRDPRNMQ